MKNLPIYIAISTIIACLLFITNPSEINHKEAVKSKLKNMFSEKMVNDIEKDENPFSRLGSGLGLLFGDAYIDKITDGLINRENYFLFSITTLEYKGERKTIGFGVLGNIFFLEKINEIYKDKSNS
jgi:hypothetical protein